jgi:hypothetical protein
MAMIERPSVEYQALSVQTQRRFRVRMIGDRDIVSVVLMAGSISSVIDQVKNRRIATPPGMTSFTVDLEDDGAEIR